MTAPVINVEGLSKEYVVGAVGRRHGTFYELLAHSIKAPFDRLRNLGGQQDESSRFCALRDVSFEVKEGERLGIIGRNGAGKSTLLKILSRITEPTRGRVTIRGRVASLLEVGTGFHAELSGRENIYLNGAILGMRKAEIARKFDEIVDFADIEKFLDTPVKRYSTGMYVRLAFAIAAHIETRILIVDEVLAVGDAQFQEKCLTRMGELNSAGRTVLFVSHNMAAVRSLCSRAILLSAGVIAGEGDVDAVIRQYGGASQTSGHVGWLTSSCGRIRLRMPFWVNQSGAPVIHHSFGERVILRFELEIAEPMPALDVGFAVIDSLGQKVFTSHASDDRSFAWGRPIRGKFVLDTDFNLPTLAPGQYRIVFGVEDDKGFTAIYSDSDLHLEITAAKKEKNAASGTLWHTSNWKVADEGSANA